MSTPAQAPPQQVPPGQQPLPPPPPQPQPSDLDDPALILALALLLLIAVSVAAVIAALRVRFAMSKAAWSALTGVLGDVMQHPPPVTGTIGQASEQVASMNAARRAQYVAAASKRVQAAVAEATAKGEDPGAAQLAALARERRFYAQHQAAMWNRATAAGKTDMEAAVHGPILGWLSVLDQKTSAECRSAHGKNYYASAMPDIGFPGAVHPSCRCLPSAPWPGGKMLPNRGRTTARAA